MQPWSHRDGSGRVVGTSVSTVGGVASPGQTLMEIVPTNRRLVVEGRLEPEDAGDIGFGQAVQLRLTGLHERNLPVLTGRVTRLSADRLVDERTGRSYFGIEVAIDEAELASLQGARGMRAGIQAGLPVEILVPLKPRTALSYLLEPLLTAFRKSGREH